jgi:hypothetical protein
MFRSYVHLQVEIYVVGRSTRIPNILKKKREGSVSNRVNFHCIYFHLKGVVRPKHVAAKE